MSYHKLSDLKQYPLIRAQLCRSASGYAVPGFSESHKVKSSYPWAVFSCGVQVLIQAHMVAAEFSFLQL